MYKCLKCGETIRAGVNNVGLQCDKCGSKLFVKERPSTRKKIISR